MITKRGLFSIAVLVALLMSLFMPVAAQASGSTEDLVFPESFYGTIHINDLDAPVGTAITTELEGEDSEQDTYYTVTAGEYGGSLQYVKVNCTDSNLVDESEITFLVKLPGWDEWLTANETAIFQKGEFVELDLTVDVETSAPEVTAVYPEGNGATITTVVYATFNKGLEEGTAFDDIKITNTDDSSDVTNVSATINSNTLNIAHDTLEVSTNYTVTIPEAAVQDCLDSTNEAYSWSFRTTSSGEIDNDPPEVDYTVPEDDAENVETTTAVSITYEVIIFGIDVSRITIKDADDNDNTLDGVYPHVVGTGDHNTIVIDHNSFGNNKTYTVDIPAGVVESESGVANEEYSWSFTTEQVPLTLTDINPEDDSTGNVTTVDVYAVWGGETLSEVDSGLSEITVYNDTDDVYLTYGTGFSASISGDKVDISHTDYPFDNSHSYLVTIPAGIVQNADGAMNDQVSWYFTIKSSGSSSSSSSSGGGGGGSSKNFIISYFDKSYEYNLGTGGKVKAKITLKDSDSKIITTLPLDTYCQDKKGSALSSLVAAYNTAPPATLEGAHIIGEAFNFTPSGAVFTPAISLVYSYEDADIPEGVAEDDLVLAYYDTTDSKWVSVGGTVDATANTLTASIAHFSTYAVLGLEPASFSVSNLKVSSAQVNAGGSETITADVTNNGGKEGTYTAVLKINGTQEDSQDVTLAGGETQTVSFVVSGKSAGTYTVDIDGQSGSFTVQAPATTSVAPTSSAPAATTSAAPSTTSAAPKTSTAPATTTQAPEPTQSTNWGLIIGIIIAVIVIAVLVSMILMKRKKA